MLTIEPMYGLSNRMLAMDAAIALARDIDRPIRVHWIGNKDLGCRFRDIFELADPIVDVIESNGMSRIGRMKLKLLHWADRVREPDFDGDTAREMTFRDFDWSELREEPDFSIAAFDRFYRSRQPYRLFAGLKPISPILERVEEVVSGFRHTVGVHIRRGDNKWSREGSPTELFHDRMRLEIDRDDETTFFLATDDPALEEDTKARFPGRVLTFPKRSYDRLTAEAIQDAAVDLYSLAGTQRIIGSHHSTFSMVAADIGGIENEVMQTAKAVRDGEKWYRSFEFTWTR